MHSQRFGPVGAALETCRSLRDGCFQTVLGPAHAKEYFHGHECQRAKLTVFLKLYPVSRLPRLRHQRFRQGPCLECGDEHFEIAPAHTLAEGGHHPGMLARLLLQLLRHETLHAVALKDDPRLHLPMRRFTRSDAFQHVQCDAFEVTCRCQ